MIGASDYVHGLASIQPVVRPQMGESGAVNSVAFVGCGDSLRS